ncbi:hypothetical protein ACFSL6_14245 [Paenibacillus thailandensis]|uniref:Uncharacterized protein n=1 Tax=Paenibacillus thailandensis TaxID=393250 RepID=A0ABW5R1A2_9BACL
MQFDAYKSNIRAYLADFYRYFEGQFKDRPVSSYSVIFEDEAADVNRYIQGVVDEISYEVREQLEQQFGREEGGALYERFRRMLPKQEVNTCVCQPPRAAEPERATEPPRSGPVYTGASAQRGHFEYKNAPQYRPRVSGGPGRMAAQRIRIVSAGTGVLLGGLTGYSIGKAAFATAAGFAIGKTALAAAAGMVIGGVALLTAAELMMGQKPKQRTYVTLSGAPNARPQQAPPRTSAAARPAGTPTPSASSGAAASASSGVTGADIKQVLAQRHQEVARFIIALVDQMESNYRHISKTAI